VSSVFTHAAVYWWQKQVTAKTMVESLILKRAFLRQLGSICTNGRQFTNIQQHSQIKSTPGKTEVINCLQEKIPNKIKDYDKYN
jgi:hypothetical protein